MDNTIDLNESMVDLIERAEAFLTAHATLVNQTPTTATTSAQSNCSSSSNIFESSVEEQESFTTAAEESPSMSRQGSTSSSSSTSGNSSGQSNHIDLLTDDNASDELNDTASTVSYEIDLPDAVPYLPPAPSDVDDCIFVSSVQVPTIDLCSLEDSSPPETPRTRQNRIRRAAESAPIVDLITLDDTIAEQPGTRRQPTNECHTIEDTRTDPPAAKQGRNSEADLDLSQSSDGGAPSRSVICPICFDSIFKKQASSTVCGHLFCYSCIKTEIQLRHKCPLCKRKITRSQIHPIYFN